MHMATGKNSRLEGEGSSPFEALPLKSALPLEVAEVGLRQLEEQLVVEEMHPKIYRVNRVYP
jgi:hypothetical protein